MTSQGVLRNAAGDVVNGVYALTFRLYDAQQDGQMLWSEVHNNVPVEMGIYTTEIGNINPIPNGLFKQNATVWMGISVEGQQELPRIQVTTVAYAFQARSAMVAQGLDCTGCISEDALGFDPVSEENVVQVVENSGKFLSSSGGVVGGTVTATAFVGDGSGLTGISSPQGTCADGWFVAGISALGELQCGEGAAAIGSVDGLEGGTITGDVEVTGTLTMNGSDVCTMDGNCGETLAQLTCEVDQVALWNGDLWVCSDILTEFDPSALPADGLDEISNDLLTNQFVDTYTASGTTAIPDNNPTGIVDSIVVPDIGIAQGLTVSINITNSDMGTVKVVLYAPNNNQYTLYDQNGPGQELGATYPTPVEPIEGDLTEWVGENPMGTWQLQVIDTGFKDNEFDGQINAWSVQIQTLSTQKVHVDGDLHVSGDIVGPEGLTINGNGTVTGSMKVGMDDSECDGDKAGALRYHEAQLQWCNGNIWNTIGEGNSMFRWAQWSTYGQAHGQWYAGNNSDMFAGVHPSHWGNSNYCAHQVSANSGILRTLFWRKGPAIGTQSNAMVAADEWYSYSSTNSRHIGALFRVRNTTGEAISWTVNWYHTGYGGWEERASVALNGQSIGCWSGNYGPHDNSSHELSIPANRTSTVIFVSASSSDSGTRSNFMAFFNNSLDLPDGLEFVDDLDYKANGWDN